MRAHGRSILQTARRGAVLVLAGLIGCLLLVHTQAPGPRHGHDHALPLAATAAEAPVLSRTGWTATASSAESLRENGAAANVLDGSLSTFWHNVWSTGTVTLPASITLDMHVQQPVSGLLYTPRSTNANGRIGQFQVHVSTDGTTWGSPVSTGTWQDDASTKTASFATVTARYVRLTALTEAGNRGPWACAAELNLLGGPVDPQPTPTGPPLDRTGWTAAASSAESVRENDAAANVLDGSLATIWHSVWSTPTPLPATITIDMHAAKPVSGLLYTPRTGSANGRIGRYEVAVSADGSTWSAPVVSGTWADTGTAKTAAFTLVTTQFVRLTALTEAGNRGSWASAAEIDLLGASTPTDPSKVGQWSSMIGFPLVPAAVALLPGNRVLLWSAYKTTDYVGGSGQTQTAILDLNTNTVSQRLITNTRHDMFCPGVAILPDGRIMVTGGNDAARTSIYDPATDNWTAGPDMTVTRGYHAMTLLPNGDVFTIGGSWSGGQGGKNGEVWSAATGWRGLTGVPVTPILTADPAGVYRADNHAWLFTLSGGRLLHAGPSKQMNWITTAGNGSITSAGLRGASPDAMNGTAVYYDVDKLVTMGGATAYQDADATRQAWAIDASGANPVVTRLPDMADARAFHNSVVLPDGQVFTVGGEARPVPFSDDTASMRPELWNPVTKAFTVMAPQAKPRVYHSWAILLPDGRVLSGGGGLCGSCTTNHPDAQIFTPPSLLMPDGSARPRPKLLTAPASATAGSALSVTTDSAVTAFSLIRFGEATHSVDNSQRRIPLTISASSGNTYQLALPADRGTLLPGPYLLFALDSGGVAGPGRQIMIS